MDLHTLRRINKERSNLENDPLETCSAAPLDEDIRCWVGKVSSPSDSPYRDTIFDISIMLPEDYPRTAPTLSFVTPIYHPNVTPQGIARLADLEPSQWSPVMTIRLLLISLQAMLSDPNLMEGCVINEEAAKLYAENRGEFEGKARQWTRSRVMPDDGT